MVQQAALMDGRIAPAVSFFRKRVSSLIRRPALGAAVRLAARIGCSYPELAVVPALQLPPRSILLPHPAKALRQARMPIEPLLERVE